MYFRLDYINDDFTIVFPLPINISRKIAAYHQELREKTAGMNIWPETLDSDIYPEFKIYYDKIAYFFDIKPEKLNQTSRHKFFIATEPIEYKKQLIPGLSYLEKLLGYDYPTETDETDTSTSGDEVITSGDTNLDIIADSLLIFKVAGLENHYSINELAKLCKQANARLKQAEDNAKKDNKGGDENLESETQDEDFIKDKAKIYNWLTNLNIEVPIEF